MRRLLLSFAAIGLMAAFSAPLFAQSGDDDGGPSGGWTPGGNDGGGPNQPRDYPPRQQDPTPPYPDGGTPYGGGGGGYGSGGSNGGGGYQPAGSYPMPTNNNPQVPQQDPAPPTGIPPIPVPGGATQGVPNVPTNSATPTTSQPTNTTSSSTSTNSRLGSGQGSNGTVPVNSNGQPVVPNTGIVGANNGILSSKASGQKAAMDRPAFGITVKMPASNTTGGNGSGGTPVGSGCDLPPEDLPPTNPGEDPPTFYGEPVQGKFCFILDASGSMAGGRIASLRAEATNTISALTDADEFDCMSYGTQFADSTMELWGGLMQATDGNKNAAVNFINGPACNPGAGTPTHRALEKACAMYSELDKMFLLTDGAPNATGSASQILANFPAWWGRYPQETVLVCVCIGGVEQAVNFMRDLAAEDDSTGVFINRP